MALLRRGIQACMPPRAERREGRGGSTDLLRPAAREDYCSRASAVMILRRGETCRG